MLCLRSLGKQALCIAPCMVYVEIGSINQSINGVMSKISSLDI